jgi:hypothetical protein
VHDRKAGTARRLHAFETQKTASSDYGEDEMDGTALGDIENINQNKMRGEQGI